MATAVGGTHPTGMHSCYHLLTLSLSKTALFRARVDLNLLQIYANKTFHVH